MEYLNRIWEEQNGQENIPEDDDDYSDPGADGDSTSEIDVDQEMEELREKMRVVGDEEEDYDDDNIEDDSDLIELKEKKPTTQLTLQKQQSSDNYSELQPEESSKNAKKTEDEDEYS